MDSRHFELLSKRKNADLFQEVEESIQEPYFIETIDGIHLLAVVDGLGYLLVEFLFGWKLIALIDVCTRIPLAIKVVQIQEYE